jgi:lysosomal acid lipase/cholesteryl ester hydrolase
MGKYDIPAVISYILAKTGRDKLIYIGHSMGTTMFWVAMETHPELNQKIELMVCSSI